MPRSRERKYLRSDTTMNQCAFDEHGKVVGIDEQDAHSVWVDLLSLGKQFRRNIADHMLKTSMQPTRGEILVTRDGTTHDTRAVSFRAKIHELPRVALPLADVQALLPRENERRSLETAKHKCHTRASWVVGHEQKDRGTKLKLLALGGFQTNIGEDYKRRKETLERLERMENSEKARRALEPIQDDITF